MRNLAKHCGVLFLVSALSACALGAAERARIEKRAHGWQLLVDGKPFVILGGQANNSSGWAEVLPQIWETIGALGANTVEMPAYWEDVEPRQGQFQFDNVDRILAWAREHRLHVVFLWFGSWKNGASNYVPVWVKQNPQRYPAIIDATGNPTGIISPWFRSTLEADRTAFAALLRHIGQVDESQGTVILVQVENETGSYGTPRDYSPEATKLFHGQVADKLLLALNRKPGTWEQVFGAEAEEAFSAWGFASYVNEVAAAGKAAYHLPMYVNCWLSEGGFERPGEDYPSGGPVIGMLDIWKAAAPDIDVIAPDIYLPSHESYLGTMAAYRRADNPLFIPETYYEPPASRRLFEAIGEFGTLGFSPFGLDATGWTNTSEESITNLAASYRLLGPMVSEISTWQVEGKLRAAVQGPRLFSHLLHIGDYDVLVEFNRPNWGFESGEAKSDGEGRVLIAQLAPAEFVLAGFETRVRFRVRRGLPAIGQRKPGDGARFLRVEEGSYSGGSWVARRQLNGDQTDFGLNLPKAGAVYRVWLDRN
jgi:beta-galactosidase GanA